MMYLKIAYLVLWFLICVWLGLQGKVRWNDHSVANPLLAPLVVLILGIYFLSFGAFVCSPFLLLYFG